MTADVEMLPLPAIDSIVKYVEDYARACVAHAAAAKDAEIEALRAEVERLKALVRSVGYETLTRAEQAETRAERLAEALEFQSALTKNLLPYQDEAVASRAEIEALRTELSQVREAYQRRTRDMYAREDSIMALRAEVEMLQAEIDNRWAQGVHTCHDKCQRIACVLRRQRDFELKRAELLAEALRAAEEYIDDVTPTWATGGQGVLTAIRAALADQSGGPDHG